MRKCFVAPVADRPVASSSLSTTAQKTARRNRARDAVSRRVVVRAGILAFSIVVSACSGVPMPAPGAATAGGASGRDATGTYRQPPQLDDGWSTASAADVGLDVAGLERMTAAIRKGEEYPNVHAVLIVKDGRLVYEEYFAGEDRRWRDGGLRTVRIEFDRDTLHDLRSVSKSVTSALAGIALGAGALPSLDTPLTRLFPEHEARATDAARRITLRHALTMSAGFDWNEQAVPYTDPTNHSERMYVSEDPVGFLLGRPAAAAPGSTWAYNSGLPVLVGLAIARANGTTIGQYAREVLFEPLGITDVEWTGPAAWRKLPELGWDGKSGWSDVADPAGSLWLRPRDLAKFGALYLDGGRWRGRQVIPPDWVRESNRRHIAVRDSTGDYGEHGYGYQWWHDRYRMPAGDLEVHTAVGNGGQRVFVIPSLRMLVLHLAGRYNDPNADWMPEGLLLEHVLPAVEGDPAQARAQTGSTAGAETASRIDSIFAEHDRTDAPGCAVGVYRAGELLFAKGYGMASLEHGLPVTPRTAFDIGSISKQFTALAVLLLERQGHLALADDIRRYLPELPDYGAPITVRDLLQHTSGLRDYLALQVLSGRRVESNEDLLDLLASQRALNFAPGSMHEYSHSDYELFGLVIERAIGEPFGEFLEREVLRPLGMVNSRVHDARRVPIPNRSFAYSPSADGFAIQFPASELVGGTSLYTTVEDLLHWDRNFYDGRVGGRELVDRLHEHPTLASGDTIPYVFGLQHGEYRGLRVVQRGGGGGFSTELMRFPEQRLAVATLCNADASHPLFLSRAVADLFLADAMQAAAEPAALSLDLVEPPPGEPNRYAGDYRPEDVPWNLLRLVARDGTLWEVFPDTMLRLTRLRDGRYHADGAFYAFSAPADGGSLRLEALWPEGAGWATEVLERIPDAERWRPEDQALAAYAGTFHSPDLDVSWGLVVRGGQLVLRRRGAPDIPLTPVDPDVMTAMLGTYQHPVNTRLHFGRDAAGAVTHFTITTPPGQDAIRELRFDRVADSLLESTQ